MLVPKPTSWEVLKTAATAQFGLTPERLEEEFYNMQPTPEEDTAHFVSRVEGVRAVRGYSDRALLHSFNKHFSPAFAASLKHIK